MANVWREAVPTTTTSTSLPSGITTGTSSVVTSECVHYFVPAGTLVFYDAAQQQTVSIVIASSAAYMPDCNDADFDSSAIASWVPSDDMSNGRNPFYRSVIPIAYAVSATTVVAWLLLILLFLAKKQRPWFQKFMMLLVSASLTVALAHTTRVLEQQNQRGYLDAVELRHEIFGSLAFRILEVLSILVVWMANLQVLLRLFERAKERMIIRWVGVILAVIDTTLWCLVNFFVPYHTGNHVVTDVIPVLAYLFQISILLIYAGSVVFYSVRKRKFAYNKRHSLIIAFISLTAVMMPLVFFILDLANYWIVGWSEFVRWVSGAASSVVVWEWIDVIERLQREKQKTGVLGRQIYDDDEYGIHLPSSKRTNTSSSSSSKSNHERNNGSQTSINRDNNEDDENSNNNSNIPITSVKRFKPRHLSFLHFATANDRWVISRTSSANTASTSYGAEIRHSSPGQPTSRPPTTTPVPDGDRPSIAALSPSFPSVSPPPTVPRAAVTSTSAATVTRTPSVRLGPSPLYASPSYSPSLTAGSPISANASTPPLVRHIHPLRRSTKLKSPSNSAISATSATPNSSSNTPSINNSGDTSLIRRGPCASINTPELDNITENVVVDSRAYQQGNSRLFLDLPTGPRNTRGLRTDTNNTNIHNSNSNFNENERNTDTDEDDDNEYDYTVLGSQGMTSARPAAFDLDTTTAIAISGYHHNNIRSSNDSGIDNVSPMLRQSHQQHNTGNPQVTPPLFEPLPGFSVDDYWAEDHKKSH